MATKTTSVKKATQKTVRTYITLCLDASSSINDYGLTEDIRNYFNNFIATTKREANIKGQQVFLQVIRFSTEAAVLIPFTDINNVSNLWNYSAYGNTALFDAVGLGIENLDAHKFAEKGIEKAFMLIAITDGEENYSRRYNTAKLSRVLKEVNKREDFTVAFQVPKGHAKGLVQGFNVPAENVREWETTKAGLVETQVATQVAVSDYLAARSAGVRKSTNFYKVTTDLSAVKPADLKASLADLSGNFKSYTVEKEVDIKTFVEDKTGKPYVVGSTFYELMKKEKVQPSKQVLLMEKAKKKVWGGREARDLIGLPANADAKVDPGNHMNYKVFVESRSTNRKLPRGTQILIDRRLAGV